MKAMKSAIRRAVADVDGDGRLYQNGLKRARGGRVAGTSPLLGALLRRSEAMPGPVRAAAPAEVQEAMRVVEDYVEGLGAGARGE